MIKKIVRTREDLVLLYKTLEKLKLLGCDVETTALDIETMDLIGVGIGSNKKMFYVPWNYPGLNNEDIIKAFNALFKKPIIFHNAKFDLKVLRKFGFNLPKDVHDTMIMSWLSDETTGNGLKYLAKNILLREEVTEYKDVDRLIQELNNPQKGLFDKTDEFKREEVIDAMGHYCMDDVRNTCDLFVKFRDQLKNENILPAYLRLEKPMVQVLNRMEMKGVRVDVKWLEMKRDKAKKIIDELVDKMYEVSGKEKDVFNFSSPKQLESLLFDEFQYNPTKFTKSGKRSTDNEALQEIIKINDLKEDDFVSCLLKYRDIDKLYRTYLIGLLEQADKNGIIHGSFVQHGTRTGRLSSRNPNLQNIPARHDEWDIRSAFIPREGHKFIISDYSQVELRVLAHFSEDSNMVEAFRNGADIHATTMRVTGITERRVAKAINFGLVYGMGPKRLAEQLEISEAEATDYINRFFAGYPKVKPFISSVQYFARKNGYIPMLTGRRRRFLDQGSRKWWSDVQRQSINTKIQGCLSGETRVLILDKGYVELKTLFKEGSLKRHKIWDGEKFVYANIVDSGVKQKIIIKTWNNQTIMCSPEHKFLTVQTNGKEKWKTALEIASLSNVYLKINNGTYYEGFDDSKNSLFKEVVIQKTSHNVKKIYLNNYSTYLSFGQILGRLASDGVVFKHKYCAWIIAEHEYAIKYEIKRELERLFGKVRERVSKRKGKKDVTWLYVDSTLLTRQLQEIKIKKQIPEELFKASRTLLQGYLRGLFDGDGGVSGNKVALTFGRGDKHYKWALEVQQALLLFGIQSRVRCYKNDRTVVVIRQRDNILFLKNIGFINPRKNEILKSILKPTPELKTYGRVERVKEVTITDEKIPMYDIVNSESHRFMANGFIVHNSAADIMKIAMLNLDKVLPKYKAQQLIQVHDEVIVECPDDCINKVKKVVQDTMESAVKLKVPLKSEPEIADHWIKG